METCLGESWLAAACHSAATLAGGSRERLEQQGFGEDFVLLKPGWSGADPCAPAAFHAVLEVLWVNGRKGLLGHLCVYLPAPAWILSFYFCARNKHNLPR